MGRPICACLVGCALLAVLPSPAAADASIAGVQKVIQMLSDVSETAKKEKAEEEIAFAKFQTWCTHEAASLKSDIAKNGLEIEALTASARKLSSDASILAQEIGQLNADVTKYRADEVSQKEQRARDRADFLAQEHDFSESVDALERAIQVLQSKSADVPGTKAALLQLADSRLPQKARSVVSAFLGMLDDSSLPDYASYSAPVADAYEFQSGGVIQMLKRLRDEFRGKLAQCQKEEMNSKHAFDMIVQDLQDSAASAEKQAAEKTTVKLSKEEHAALDSKQLAATSSVKAENEKTLSNLEAECRQKSLSFEEKQHLRTEELEALAKAVDILSSPDVLGVAQKHLSLVSGAQGRTALLQIRAGGAAGTPGPRRRLREFLQSEGRRLHSQRLTLLSEAAADDPFAKVKQMISDLLTKLYTEANEDAKHEGFCDAELGKSVLTRNRLAERIDSLTASVESGKANILSLAQSVADLSAEVQSLQAAVKEATANRADEKAENSQTVRDAEAASAAVAQATAVLKDFYAKALTSTALLQQAVPARQWGIKATIKMGSPEWRALADPKYDASKLDTGHKDGMQTFGQAYQGKQDEINNGVLALMEVIASDFANLKADTLASEAASQRAFDEFVKESKKNAAVKQRSIEMSEADKASAELRVQEDTKELKGTEDELLAAERYHENLVPQCIDQGVTFEARTKSRAEEIASLKMALQMLGSADIA